MANDTIGKVPCAFCSTPAPVRKNAKAKLYYVCNGCGIVQPNMPGFQEWILDHATITGATPAAQVEKGTEEKPAEQPETLREAIRATGAKTSSRVHVDADAPRAKPTEPTPPKKPRGFGVIRF